MLLVLKLLNIGVNLIVATFMGSCIIIGFVFFLIGFQGERLSKLAKGKQTRIDLIKIFSTLGILAVILLLSFESLRTTGHLAFASPDPETARQVGVKLMLLGMAQGAWFFVSLKWLLPLVFDPVNLNKKQTRVVITAPLLNLLAGLFTFLRAGTFKDAPLWF